MFNIYLDAPDKFSQIIVFAKSYKLYQGKTGSPIFPDHIFLKLSFENHIRSEDRFTHFLPISSESRNSIIGTNRQSWL